MKMSCDVLESAERVLTIFSHVTSSSGIRPEDFASLIALDSSSLINNPCREFLVMQREAAAKGLSRSATISGDSQETSSWHREKKQPGQRESREIVDMAFHLMITRPPSSTASWRWRERIADTASGRTLLSYSYASAFLCCIIADFILLAPESRKNVWFYVHEISSSVFIEECTIAKILISQYQDDLMFRSFQV